ncbi:MAG: hypothetical protein ACYTFG_20640 [Planctomycetota bacterium]|jgi:hypothetical protein
MMRRFAVSAALICVLATSCTTLRLPSPDKDPSVLALRDPEKPPMPYAVAVSPVEADLAGVVAPGSGNYPVADDMASILDVAQIFSAVKAVPLFEDGSPAIPPDADFLLRLRAHRLEVKYEGRNGYFIPNLFLWAAFIFPAWWVPDETFSGRVDLEAVLVSARSGNRLGSHTASVVVTRDLDDFERGWIPLGIVLAPHAFSRRNYRCAARQVLLPAIRKAEVDLARWINDSFRKRMDEGEVDSLSATTFALCAGVSKYESLKIHNLRRPRREALMLSQFLGDPQLGGVRRSRVDLLMDADATREELLARLEETLVNRPRRPDTVLIYLSGYGTVNRTEKGASHAFLTYGSDPEDPGSPRLLLSELRSVISRSSAGRVIVILDSGFAGGPAARGIGPPPAMEKELHGLCAEMVVRGGGFVLLVERTGLSGETSFLPDLTGALAGAGDLDHDGAVTAAELQELFTKKSPPKGCTVRIFGEGLDKIRIPFARGRTK